MTTQRFLAHYVCWGKEVKPMSLMCVEPWLHTVTVSPYEREIAGTRFCDGILLATNASFEAEKHHILAELKAKGLFSLPVLAAYLADTSLLSRYCMPPVCHLYTLVPSLQTKDISLHEILPL